MSDNKLGICVRQLCNHLHTVGPCKAKDVVGFCGIHHVAQASRAFRKATEHNLISHNGQKSGRVYSIVPGWEEKLAKLDARHNKPNCVATNQTGA